jgi:topoisomerase-4 subunit B
MNSRAGWVNTTHDWAGTVDQQHLEQIRSDPAHYTPGGLIHLVLEVLAYPEDEAESAGRHGTCTVTLHANGSIAIEDDGRGTDTRVDEHGRLIKKPIMATQDLRFFANPSSPLLPDNHARRGMSVVAVLSDWLVHTNRRLNGSWTQRYEYGVPVTDLEPVESTSTTGTTVHFHPDPAYFPGDNLTADDLDAVLTSPHLDIRVIGS